MSNDIVPLRNAIRRFGAALRLHMGPNNLCYVTRHFFILPHVTFYKTLTSPSTVFIKGHVGFLQLLKVAMLHFVFYPCGAFVHDVNHAKPIFRG